MASSFNWQVLPGDKLISWKNWPPRPVEGVVLLKVLNIWSKTFVPRLVSRAPNKQGATVPVRSIISTWNIVSTREYMQYLWEEAHSFFVDEVYTRVLNILRHWWSYFGYSWSAWQVLNILTGTEDMSLRFWWSSRVLCILTGTADSYIGWVGKILKCPMWTICIAVQGRKIDSVSTG